MRDEPDERLVWPRKLDALALQGEQEAFDSAAESDAGCGAAAELLDQIIVPAPAADRVLRAQPTGGDLPQRVGVVIEPANQRPIELERHTGVLQQRLHALDMSLALLRQITQRRRRASGSRNVARVFAVKNAQQG